MSTFLERLKEEKSQLDERISKLGQFIAEKKHVELPIEMQLLLEIQYKAMLTYQECLAARLCLIESN